jgi:transcriptional regulator with GAF, ATPase, and Fis domain
MAIELDPAFGSGPMYDELAEISQWLYLAGDLSATFARLTRAAVDLLPACDSASVTVIEGPELRTEGATDQVATHGDRIQYDEQEGPCLDAATREQWVYTPDVRHDVRWPRFSPRLAAELEVRSMFSCRLGVQEALHRHLGGLNLYSRGLDAFDDEQRDLALLLAAVGSVAADAARVKREMADAVRTRQIIGEAIGILRSQTEMTSQEAFEALSKASQRSNVKLRDLAAKIAAAPGTGAADPG